MRGPGVGAAPLQGALAEQLVAQVRAGVDGRVVLEGAGVLVDDRHRDPVDVAGRVPEGPQVERAVQQRDEAGGDDREPLHAAAGEAAQFGADAEESEHGQPSWAGTGVSPGVGWPAAPSRSSVSGVSVSSGASVSGACPAAYVPGPSVSSG
ncbi:hypothetical protein SDC9_175794 [bioreactor metagenome]|uniref:Uncharacterized protein n=1 Tax=bioreactor metagenome TaxID=1076179 RepID=A0A645GXH1_9ZZZZ